MKPEIEATYVMPKDPWTPPLVIQEGSLLLETQPIERDYLNLRRTAARLDHSYFWLSRNYRRLGLRPSKVGGKLLFERTEVDRLLKRLKVGISGRPRARRL